MKTIGVLREGSLKDKCFCTEGLMCQIYHEDTGLGDWVRDEGSNTYMFRRPFQHVAEHTAPPEVYEHFGLPHEFQGKPPYGDSWRLNALNDRGLSFKQIAKVLKRFVK